MSVGGFVISYEYVDYDYIRFDIVEREYNQVVSVHVYRDENCENVNVGDTLWWQEDTVFWTPRSRRFIDFPLRKKGNSFTQPEWQTPQMKRLIPFVKDMAISLWDCGETSAEITNRNNRIFFNHKLKDLRECIFNSYKALPFMYKNVNEEELKKGGKEIEDVYDLVAALHVTLNDNTIFNVMEKYNEFKTKREKGEIKW